jgi:hypothetical protein
MLNGDAGLELSFEQRVFLKLTLQYGCIRIGYNVFGRGLSNMELHNECMKGMKGIILRMKKWAFRTKISSLHRIRNYTTPHI